jgi:hypothetical protein
MSSADIPKSSGTPLNEDERAELHALRDLRARLVGFGGDDFTLMPWVEAHRHHAEKPYIGCVFCRDRFVLAEPVPNDLNDGPGRDLVDVLTPLVHEADARHEVEGGGTRHWVRDYFLPELRAAGLTVSVASSTNHVQGDDR